MPENPTQSELLAATAAIASSYFSQNPTSVDNIGSVIGTIYSNVTQAFGSSASAQTPSNQTSTPLAQNPAVDPKDSVFPDYIICLEDGKRLTMLKRHLKTSFDLTPEQYRTKWGLPKTYPLTAPNYAAKRSELAKAAGLGLAPAKRKARLKASKPAAVRGRASQTRGSRSAHAAA